jgi:hypothetical protein
MPIGAAIDWDSLWRAIWTGLLAGVGFSTVSALTLLGAIRVSEAREHGDLVGTFLYGLLALLAGAAAVGFVVFGLIAMTSK